MKKILFVSAIICLFLNASAQFLQPPVTQKLLIIETENTALVLSVANNHKLYQVYLGEKLKNAEDYKLLPILHEAYIPSGTDNLFEPAIKMLHNDGNPSLELLFSDEKVTRDGNLVTTSILLKDPKYPVEVRLNCV